jgi:hypothetical protein
MVMFPGCRALWRKLLSLQVVYPILPGLMPDSASPRLPLWALVGEPAEGIVYDAHIGIVLVAVDFHRRRDQARSVQRPRGVHQRFQELSALGGDWRLLANSARCQSAPVGVIESKTCPIISREDSMDV